MVWAGEEAVEVEGGEEDRAQTLVELTDLRQLGIATLGTLRSIHVSSVFGTFSRAGICRTFTRMLHAACQRQAPKST